MNTEHLAFQVVEHTLSNGSPFFSGQIPEELAWHPASFQTVWDLHPTDFHSIMIHGRRVKTPRWQQAHGIDYHYTGQTNLARPIPEILKPLVDWSQSSIDPRLNGVLLNYYDGSLGHYIGAHHDSVRNMVVGAGIVTISFGDAHTFRMTRGKGAERQVRDFPAEHCAVFVLPWETNLSWKHEVPHFARNRGRRISVTLRAFIDGAAADGDCEPKPAA